MEEAHRTHKEPAWGWISVLLAHWATKDKMAAKPRLTATRRRVFTRA